MWGFSPTLPTNASAPASTTGCWTST